jgi:ABC-type polysaccharide/polyol phosphate transport system ATPase subunit
MRQARQLSIVAVTHSPELVRRLSGSLLYLVKGHTQAYERLDEAPDGAIMDQRLQSFLAGDHP